MSDRGAARVFFFKHSLERHAVFPGRYSFAVRGSALTRSGTGFMLNADWRGRVYADAYADETPGPNLDPNVFSDVLPWHLSFCRICKRVPKNLIDGAPLSHRVRTGDVVMFGNAVSTHILFVDTVLCVTATPQLPKRGNELVLYDRYADLKAEVPQLEGHDWNSFAATRSYELNLADAAPGRGHHWSGVSPHRMIVGRRWDDPTDITPDELLQRFVGGAGFNFIPLANEQASNNQAVVRRPGLYCQRFEPAGGLLKQANVVELGHEDGERLLRTVFDAVDVLVLDPIEPEHTLRSHFASEVPMRGGDVS